MGEGISSFHAPWKVCPGTYLCRVPRNQVFRLKKAVLIFARRLEPSTPDGAPRQKVFIFGFRKPFRGGLPTPGWRWTLFSGGAMGRPFLGSVKFSKNQIFRFFYFWKFLQITKTLLPPPPVTAKVKMACLSREPRTKVCTCTLLCPTFLNRKPFQVFRAILSL